MTSPSTPADNQPGIENSAGNSTETNIAAIPVAEQIGSLAQAVHEGDWMMKMEWRWDRATEEEQARAYVIADRLIECYANGVTDPADLSAIIDDVEQDRRGGWQGRLRAKTAKVVQWFEFRDRGLLLNR